MPTFHALVSEARPTCRIAVSRWVCRSLFLANLLMLGTLPLSAQPKTGAISSVTAIMQNMPGAPDTTNANVLFINYETEPQFPGGETAMRTYLQQNLRYPLAARRASVSGKVYVSFVINVDGSLTDVKALRGLGFGTDEEAVRLVQAMPVWKPGTHSGKAVRMRYNLPVTFSL